MNKIRKIIVVIIIGLFLIVGIASNSNADHIGSKIDVDSNQCSFNQNSKIFLETSFEEEWERDNNNDYLAPPGWDVDGICSGHQNNQEELTHYWSQINKDFSYTHNQWTGNILHTPFVYDEHYSAFIWSAQDSQADEWLITPPLDFNDPSLYDITLQFWSIYVPTLLITIPFPDIFFVDNEYLIEISDNNGATWNTVTDLRDKRYADNGTQLYNYFDHPITIDLDSLKGSDQARIAWHYLYNGTGINDLWVVDKVHISAKKDTIEPRIIFKKPLPSSLYFDNTKIHKIIKNTIILGDIDIEVNANDYETEIEKVEFYIDDTLVETFISEPYLWHWNDFSFGKHTISIGVIDSAGNSETEEMTVFKFF